MNDFLNSIKADLLDRHRLPYLIALCVALVAVLGYAMLGGGSSGSSGTASSAPAEPLAKGAIAVSAAPSTADAAAETSSGATQGKGPGRNFFKPLPGSEQSAGASSASIASSATATSASAGASSGASTSSSSTTPSGSGSESPSQPSASSKPSTPSQPKPPQATYDVSLLFGVASPPPAVSQLTPTNNAKRGLQLPSSQVPLVTFSGWTTGGGTATFTLSGEAILHGSAKCVPSPTQCSSIELKTGEAEQLEYVPASGPVVTYELKVVSITPSNGNAATASAARARAARARAARTARAHTRARAARTRAHASGRQHRRRHEHRS